MAAPEIRALDPGYTTEIDSISEPEWYEALQNFDDANIYQTWAYGAALCGPRNISHLILKKDGEIVAIAQARIAKLPHVNMGIAYIRWGPLWRRRGIEPTVGTFRQAIRALRNEFVSNRGLVLRIFPLLFDDDSPSFSPTLAAEEFQFADRQIRLRTLIMDLRPSLEELREGMRRNWRRYLRVAERSNLEVVEGAGDELFLRFIGIYAEMVFRKRFLEPDDIHRYRLIQRYLPEKLKMNIMLCVSGGEVCAGVVWSTMGQMAVPLFGATSNVGLKYSGSFLLHWRLIEKLKREGTPAYNLMGVDPKSYPGTYKFKNDLAGENGKDINYRGRFDSYSGFLNYSFVQCADASRMAYQRLKELMRAGRRVGLSAIAASQTGS